MPILNTNRNFKKKFDKVRNISSVLEHKLSQSDQKNALIDDLTYDELKDLNQVLHLADYMLCKHEDKKEFHALLREFVEMINESILSIDTLNDEIDEMVISAESALTKIKGLQKKVSNRFSFEPKSSSVDYFFIENPESGGNNLTKSSTQIHTVGYQEKITIESD